MLRIIFATGFFFVSVFGMALKAQEVQGLSGQLEVFQDSRIDTLIEKHIFLNKQFKTIEGYKIQIFFDAGNNSKHNAYDERDNFIEKYPDYYVSVTFNEPYYRVRVGAFRSRMEAEGLLTMIKADYPNAFVIKDEIDPLDVN